MWQENERGISLVVGGCWVGYEFLKPQILLPISLMWHSERWISLQYVHQPALKHFWVRVSNLTPTLVSLRRAQNSSRYCILLVSVPSIKGYQVYTSLIDGFCTSISSAYRINKSITVQFYNYKNYTKLFFGSIIGIRRRDIVSISNIFSCRCGLFFRFALHRLCGRLC